MGAATEDCELSPVPRVHVVALVHFFLVVTCDMKEAANVRVRAGKSTVQKMDKKQKDKKPVASLGDLFKGFRFVSG